MKRRDFIALLGGSVLGPVAVRAQQPERVRRVGFLLSLTENDPEAHARIAAFREGLEVLGWSEPRNVRVDYRFAGGDAERVNALVAEMVASAPDVIVAHSSQAATAFKQVTSTIPIVFVAVNDPVGQGLVTNLAHPSGNITGFTFVDFEMIGKCLELLKDIAPGMTRAGLMFHPGLAPYFHDYLREIGAGSARLAVEASAVPVRDASEIEAAITRLGPNGGLIVAPDPFTVVNREAIMRSAERHRLPAIYTLRQDVVEGALMSYGPDAADIFRRTAFYVDRILKGVKPDELPVQAPTKFELVINLKTAMVLGLDVPSTLSARADEVIE
jgi:putative tryptophan/tyrosine transport system substrate-binding protein